MQADTKICDPEERGIILWRQPCGGDDNVLQLLPLRESFDLTQVMISLRSAASDDGDDVG